VTQAAERAREFLEREKAFRLGELLTESSHPKTQRLSQTMQADVPAGIRMLQSVDDDIPPALERIFAQESFGRLVDALRGAIRTGHRIYFTGCGATGRLSILLEAAWRRFWTGTGQPPGVAPAARMADLCVSVMAGGDFALIKSVEGFEDFPDFGRRQIREAGVVRDDVVVAITEGGETPFVIGTAWQGLDAGAHVFFVYNNPTDLLRRHVQRSREVIEEPRIAKLDLATGPMAIAGSTRMQATTVELLVVGAAMEMALAEDVGWPVPTVQDYRRLFGNLVTQLSSPPAVAAIARVVELEEAIYRRRGLVTYLADSLMLDVLTDTTERSPTFMIPPFRRQGDATSPVSWAFVKNPGCQTEQAWHDMLQREPRGLTWGPEVYRELDAPSHIQGSPPKLDNDEIHRFRIGNEPDPSRTNAPDSMLVQVGDVPNHPSSIIRHPFKRTGAITFGPAAGPLDVDEHIHVPCDLPSSPLCLWEHLAVKLILNTLSTATMVRMGRVIGNAMVWVSPSNKKLIDRGCRLIVQETGCTYERACEVLHEAMEELAERAKRGEEVPSPVALAIERIGRGT
jgi:N-acetylmuramic acid 6-phosphate etherase